jgi:hypothetical protein
MANDGVEVASHMTNDVTAEPSVGSIFRPLRTHLPLESMLQYHRNGSGRLYRATLVTFASAGHLFPISHWGEIHAELLRSVVSRHA